MTDAERIARMGPDEILALSARMADGDQGAVRDYILRAAWRAIMADPFIPPQDKRRSFRAVCEKISVVLEPALG